MITILCSGSRGDFQPYIVLAQEIKSRGYDVCITAGCDYQQFIESYGIECYPLKASISNVDIDPKFLENSSDSVFIFTRHNFSQASDLEHPPTKCFF